MEPETRHDADGSLMKRLTGLAIAAGVLLAFSLNVQAADCTIANWDDFEGLTTGENTGTQENPNIASGNRRYFGPCGLRVPFGGSESWLENRTDGSGNALDEPSYRVRFFGFFESLTSAGTPVPFFEGYDAENPAGRVFSLFFDESSGIGVDVNGDGSVDEWFSVGNGWQEIEIGYTAGENFVFSLNGESASLGASSSRNVTFVRLGDIDGVGSGWADFDEFDSRRVSFPSDDPQSVIRLGDANGDGAITGGDLTALVNELLGDSIAAGQADCNEDGSITGGDLTCLVNILLAQ